MIIIIIWEYHILEIRSGKSSMKSFTFQFTIDHRTKESEKKCYNEFV